jgi:4-amino-4-deoxy-L-arabinose transferase-like glycosyltransferase
MSRFTDNSHRIIPTSLFWVLLAGLAMLGIGLMVYITPYGMGLVNDSVGYIGGARTLLQGQGYSRITGDLTLRSVTNYPPMYSIFIALVSLLGFEPLAASYVLNVALFGLNVFLIGWIVRQVSRSDMLAWITAVLFAISKPVLVSHAYAMSEPLYLALVLITLLLLTRYFQAGRWGWLAIAGVTSSLALLTRYVGISLYAVALLGLAFFLPEMRRRLAACEIYLAFGIPAVAAWMIRNMLVSESAANRLLIWHSIPSDKLQEGLINFWGWLLPEAGGFISKLLPVWGAVFGLLVVVWAAGLALSIRRYHTGQVKITNRVFILGWLCALEGLVYLATVVVSMLLLDASPIFEDRILLPFEVFVLMIAVVFLNWLWQRREKKVRAVVALLVVGLTVFMVKDTVDIVRDLHKDGLGFASARWSESPALLAGRELKGKILFSNKPTSLYILNDQPAFILPSPINPATQQPREGYQQNVNDIRQQIQEGRAYIIVFDYNAVIETDEGKTWMTDITQGLPVYGSYEDGKIFGLKP